MNEKEQEKTVFYTDQSVYCYTTMPFGLKNTGTTYQRLVNRTFKSQIGRNVETYVDDILLKSQKISTFLFDLKEVLEILRNTRMMLNPKKCIFRVTSEKFLGYLVSRRGIEANPEKVKVIQEISPPRYTRDVQRLTGRLGALNRFLSQSASKALPFFKVLKKTDNFSWTGECQQAFEQLNEYLHHLSTLTSSRIGDKLYLYLSAADESVSVVLIREESVQMPVYYVSRVLRDPKIRYTQAKKLMLALIHAARRLKPYFLAHYICLRTDQPLKQVLSRPETSGRLTKWVIELGEYDLSYEPRTAIKAQALADFIAELTFDESNESISTTVGPQQWILHVDDSSNNEGSGAGLLLEDHQGELCSYALKFDFAASNNEIEYKAVIAGLQLAHKFGVQHILVNNDSQLVVCQYEAREEVMQRYLSKVRQLTAHFESFEIQRIPRSQNRRADALSRLASTSFSDLNKIVLVEVLAEPDYAEEIVCPVYPGDTWMSPLIRFLSQGELSEDRGEARKLQRKAGRYALRQNVLYKRSYLDPWLRCTTPEEGKRILQDIHEGLCGAHVGYRMLVKKNNVDVEQTSKWDQGGPQVESELLLSTTSYCSTMLVQADFSRGGRWAESRTTKYVPSHVVSVFRYQLTMMDVDEVDTVSRIGSICNRYLDPANPAQCAHPGLTLIRKEAFRTLQYLNQGIQTAVGPFDHHDVGTSTSRAAPFEMLVEHLPRQVRGRNQGGRHRRRATSLRDDDVPVTQTPHASSHAQYDPNVVTQFSHSGSFYTPPCVPAFGSHLNMTPTALSDSTI
ncbi:uncharacterized protein LOC113782511 [Coffea eugenioides]|uniref:uncharacterized protein LOC113782511 n=1 Tax=Coffea eugenioides TaxID=49369 RepID=UPI000F615CA3|nr:uncharacterized protein LOC113782511 [Coffea eugenioides]